jgi:hypothetical protein
MRVLVSGTEGGMVRLFVPTLLEDSIFPAGGFE